MIKNYDKYIEKIEKFIRKGDFKSIRELLYKAHPTDIAYIASHIDEEYEGEFLTEIKTYSNIEDILPELRPELFDDFLESLSGIEITELFSKLDPDESAKILSRLPANMAEWVFNHMESEDSKEAENLLKYDEDQAGRIMTTDYFSMDEDATVFDAFTTLKEEVDAETIYYLYVTDSRNHLVGVVSLRELLTKPNHVVLKEIMETEIISFNVTLDKEEVAKAVERYNFSVVPVVDHKNRLLGIITVDDVIDVIRSEATEDIMKLAGTTEGEFSLQSPYRGFMRRMPWLLVSFFGGMITIQSNLFFSGKIPYIELLAFITVIAGMGGNIASQSSTIVVRGLATGKILVTELWEVLLKEVSIGILLGTFFGFLLGIVSALQFDNYLIIGISVGFGMFTSMIIAAFIGSLMPIVFQRFNIDPAVATGPFVTTTIDNLGLLSYFSSTLLIIRMLS